MNDAHDNALDDRTMFERLHANPLHKVTWHRGLQPGEWYATLGEQTVARADRNASGLNGFARAYKLSLHGPLFIYGAVNGHYPCTFRECKEIVALRYESYRGKS